MSELDDLASPLTKLRVNPIPNEFGAYQGEAGPSRYALRDPGVTPSRREPPKGLQLPQQRAKPPQGLDFNLFRSSTVSTVSSSTYDDDRSLYSSPDSPEEANFPQGEDEPSTPKAIPPAFQVISRPSTRTPTRETSGDGYFNLALPVTTSVKHAEGPQIQTPALEDGGDTTSMHGEQGEWGEDEAAFEWLDSDARADGNVGNDNGGPRMRMLRAASGGSIRLKKKLVILPTRAAPPPPLEAVSAPMPLGMRSRQDGGRTTSSPTIPSIRQLPTAKSRSHEPLQRSAPSEPLSLTQQMRYVPPKDDSPTTPVFRSATPTHLREDAHQPAALSHYDLDGRTSLAAPPSSDIAFPKGKYVKLPPGAPIEPKTVGDFLRSGIEARANGELARSAYFFMKAAEGGSASGRIYYGLALRHGSGVAKDQKKGFNELRRACDDALANGALDDGALDPKQRRDLNRDISFAIFEVANCFLDGAGVKKSPEVGVAYLRFAAKLGDIQSQEQLGFLLAKGKGVKKDLKEAARWYRTAIAQGSPNTFGLAWIYKEKYL